MAVVVACAQRDETKTPGQLIVSIQSDMAFPRSVDGIEVQVYEGDSNGGTSLLFDNTYAVPADQLIPATLTILAGSTPGAPVTIRVMGRKGSMARTLREATTTLPANRKALLRMPIEWLCDDAAATSTSSGTLQVTSTCGNGFTCSAGHCVPSAVAEPTLPDFQPAAVFGGATGPGSGACFDTLACMASGTSVTPDANCTIAAPGSGDVNIALRVAGDGICNPAGTTCFVPLDAKSPEGWQPKGDRIALPAAACTRLTSGLVSGVVLSTSCRPKTEATPPCGPWSSVKPMADAAAPRFEASTDGPTRVASLFGDAGAGSVCCPLLSDAAKLYACACTAGSGAVSVVGVDPSAGSTMPVASFSPQLARPTVFAALHAGGLYWTDRLTLDGSVVSVVERTDLSSGATANVASIDGDLFDATSLLADPTHLYALASLVKGQGNDVQLVKIDEASGATTPFDTGSATAVLQFDQDATSVYMISERDSAAEGGASITRTSNLEAITKADGTRTLLGSVDVTTPSVSVGGFFGVHVSGPSVYVLSQGTPGADGMTSEEVLQVDAATHAAKPIYTQTVDPTKTSLRILGVVDGVPVLLRSDGVVADAGAGRSEPALASVVAVPPDGGAPRVVAAFANDAPVGDLTTVSFDTAIYWINGSGTVYRLPRSALK